MASVFDFLSNLLPGRQGRVEEQEPSTNFQGALSALQSSLTPQPFRMPRPSQGGPRSTEAGVVIPSRSGRFETVYPVAPTFKEAPLQSVVQDPLRTTGLRDELIRQGRDRAAANALPLAATRTAADILPVRPIAQGLDYFSSRAFGRNEQGRLGRDLFEQPQQINKPNVLSDILVADRQGLRSGGPIGFGAQAMESGVQKALTAETVGDYVKGLGGFAFGGIIAGADYIPGGKAVTGPLRAGLRETAETASQRAARNVLGDFAQQAPRGVDNLTSSVMREGAQDVLPAIRRDLGQAAPRTGRPTSQAFQSVQANAAIPQAVRNAQRELPRVQIPIESTVKKIESRIDDPVKEAVDFNARRIASESADAGNAADSAFYRAVAINNRLLDEFASAVSKGTEKEIIPAYATFLEEATKAASNSGRNLRVYQELIKESPVKFLFEGNTLIERARRSGVDVKDFTKKDRDTLLKLGDQFQKADDELAKGRIAGQATKIIENYIPREAGKLAFDWFRASILSGLSTAARNVLGLARAPLLDLPVRGVQRGLSALRQAAGGGPTALPRNIRTGLDEAGQSLKMSWDDFVNGTNSFQTDTMTVGTQRFIRESDDPALKAALAVPEGVRRLSQLTTSSLDNAQFMRIKAQAREELAELARRRGIEPTPDVLERLEAIADLEAAFRTFINDSVIKRAFAKVQNLGESVAGKNSFLDVIGKMTTPIVGVPANILSQGLVDFTPLGLAKTFSYILEARKGGDELTKLLRQRKIDESLARSLVGSGYIGLGAAGATYGVIVSNVGGGERETNLQRSKNLPTLGINIDALKRVVQKSFEPGETTSEELKKAGQLRPNDLVQDIAPLQPVGIALSLGASWEWAREEARSLSAFEKFEAGVESALGVALENPAFTTLNRLVQIKDRPIGALTDLGRDITLGLISPSIANDFAKVFDENVRETLGGGPLEEIWNRFASRTPFLSKTLPERVDLEGKTQKRDAGALPGLEAPTRVFGGILPRRVTQSNLESIQRKLYDLTGDSSILPRKIDRESSWRGVSYSLDNKEITRQQKILGEATLQAFTSEVLDPSNADKDPTQLVNAIDRAISPVNTALKTYSVLDALGADPEGLSLEQLQTINEVLSVKGPTGAVLFDDAPYEAKQRAAKAMTEALKKTTSEGALDAVRTQ